MSKITLLAIATFTTFTLIACGGSSGGGGNGSSGGGSSLTIPSYSGSTSAATVSAGNQEALSQAASRGAQQAISSGGGDNIPLGAQIETEQTLSNLSRDNIARVEQRYLAEQLPLAFVETEACGGPNDGTIVSDFPGIASRDATPPASGSATFTFNDCNVGEGSIFDGVIALSWNGGFDADQGDFRNTVTTYDVDVTLGGQTQRIQATLTCTDFSASCSYSQYFVDGEIDYQLTDVTVFGDNSSGYSVSARVFHETLGYIDISGTGLTVCENGNFGTGEIVVTDSTGDDVLQISYISCDQIALIFNDVATTYDQ